jgi:DegV family protein with EDD domain
MTIRIVTDSTADLPESLVQRHGICVLPAYINMAGESYQDGIDLSRQEFYTRLPDLPSLPTTAAPASGAFMETYLQLAEEGATDIISIHIASTLSAILNSARLGAEAAGATRKDLHVHLFDSRQLSMGLGLLVLIAAEAAAAGRNPEEIMALLQNRVQYTYVVAVLDTLEFLRRSGRVNWTEFSLGTLLKIKPLITVFDGEAKSSARVRTSKRAVNQMISLLEAFGSLERMAILHTTALSAAEDLRGRLHHLFPGSDTPEIVEVTPAIGAHIGPGAVGVACVVAPSSPAGMV